MAPRTPAALLQQKMTLGPVHETPCEAGARRFRHWQVSQDETGTAWLLLDREDSSVNSLTMEICRELPLILDEIVAKQPVSLVIRSAKPAGFCVGADIREFQEFSSQRELETAIGEANAILDRLEDLPFPTIAVIHGDCLGGGLELALACDFRIAIDGAKFGFPEVMLGLHPGLGGTVRITQLIDPTEAMTMMLTGKSAHTAKAKRLGIVDAVTHERHVRNAVRAAANGELEGTKHGLKETVLSTLAAREIASRRMLAKTEERVRQEHYPAPFKLIELWREHGGDIKAMRQAETESFAELMLSQTAQNLIRVFHLREGLKHDGRNETVFRHVHVIGAGTMGGDIAGWCAVNGLRVSLSDIDRQLLGDAIKRTTAMAEQKHLNPRELQAALDRLIPDADNKGVKHADIVIEAAPEKIDLKQQIYQDVEPAMRADAILATNTSSIPLDTLAGELKCPGRFIGVHFFNPVAVMQLVEVVGHDAAKDDTLTKAKAFVKKIDKLPAPVRNAPGFLVNRCLAPYLLEALLMLDEGISAETIDQAAERFGMPMGPVELADRVGLDIVLSVAEVLRNQLDAPSTKLPAFLSQKVKEGAYGQKSDRGLYVWKDGKAQKRRGQPEPDIEMEDRLMLPLLNTCAACLRQDVVADTDTADAALIFATGFAPFHGGPMHYAKRRGYKEIARRLEELHEKFGARFSPDTYWRGQDGE